MRPDLPKSPFRTFTKTSRTLMGATCRFLWRSSQIDGLLSASVWATSWRNIANPNHSCWGLSKSARLSTLGEFLRVTSSTRWIPFQKNFNLRWAKTKIGSQSTLGFNIQARMSFRMQLRRILQLRQIKNHWIKKKNLRREEPPLRSSVLKLWNNLQLLRSPRKRWMR